MSALKRDWRFESMDYERKADEEYQEAIREERSETFKSGMAAATEVVEQGMRVSHFEWLREWLRVAQPSCSLPISYGAIKDLVAERDELIAALVDLHEASDLMARDHPVCTVEFTCAVIRAERLIERLAGV